MRNYNLPHFIIYLFVITATICSAQKSVSKEAAYQYLPDDLELYNTIVSMDSLFQAYNNCDLDKQADIYSDDIEFYHDKGGIMTVKQEILNNTEKYVCGKVTRELVEGSIEIYPIKDFGAIEIGLHKFHNNTEKKARFPMLVSLLFSGKTTILTGQLQK